MRTDPTAPPWDGRSTPGSSPTLEGTVDADVAVLGGGLAGLATAYFLSRTDPGLDVVVLEARTVGAGSTGRSTGIVGPGIGGPIDQLRRRSGDGVARAVHADSLAFVRLVQDLVAEERIDCELRSGAQFVHAWTPGQARSLRAQSRAFAELGFDVPYLSREELAGQRGADVHAGALRHPLAATLDPLRLCRGLRERLWVRGVRVFEHSPVTGLSPGAPIRVRTPFGAVRAGRVVVATDSYPGRPGVLDDAVTALVAHVVRTAPLPPERLAALGLGPGDSAVDARRFFDYYRVTDDGRVVAGGARVAVPAGHDTTHLGPDPHRRAAAWTRIEAELAALLPGGGPPVVTERWSGRFGATFDRLPVVGRVPDRPGVWYAGAWCGHGLALSVGAAARLAERMTGPDPDARVLPWLRDRPPQLPPRPVRRVALHRYVQALDALDRVQTRRSAVGGGRRRPPADVAVRERAGVAG
ncbi:NAD(P)/FAD-dependent oxidoreductase [Geodermatophilus sp. SYSU D00742]